MNKKELVNLTAHEITFVTKDGEIKLKPSGKIARVSSVTRIEGEINGIPLARTRFGKVEGLPEPKKDTIYVVSFPVLQYLCGTREDVVAPDTSPDSVIRDGKGQIIGVRRLHTF